jgi:hypothetical protein
LFESDWCGANYAKAFIGGEDYAAVVPVKGYVMHDLDKVVIDPLHLLGVLLFLHKFNKL